MEVPVSRNSLFVSKRGRENRSEPFRKHIKLVPESCTVAYGTVPTGPACKTKLGTRGFPPGTLYVSIICLLHFLTRTGAKFKDITLFSSAE